MDISTIGPKELINIIEVLAYHHMLNLLHIQPPSLQVRPNTVRYSAFDAEISISITVCQIKRLIEAYEEQLHIINILMILCCHSLPIG